MREEATPAASSARAARAPPASAPAPASRLRQGGKGGVRRSTGAGGGSPAQGGGARAPAAGGVSGRAAGRHPCTRGARRRRRRRRLLPLPHPASRPLREEGPSWFCSCGRAGGQAAVRGFVGPCCQWQCRAPVPPARRPPHLLRPHDSLDAPPCAQTGACGGAGRAPSALWRPPTTARLPNAGPALTSERPRLQAAGGQRRGLHCRCH